MKVSADAFEIETAIYLVAAVYFFAHKHPYAGGIMLIFVLLVAGYVNT